MLLRPYQEYDREAIIALIDGVYREYGDVICLTDADSDLLDIPGRYLTQGGAFVVLEDDGRLLGTHAALPISDRPGVCTFRRLYLDKSLRGGPWGERLMQWAIDWAKENNIRQIEFWSDTRFARAHRFFQRLGFQKDGRVRQMDDGAAPYEEYFFFLELSCGAQQDAV